MHTYFHYPLYLCNKNHCKGIIVIKSFLFYSKNSSQCIFVVKIVVQFNENACDIISLATDIYRKNHLPCTFTMKFSFFCFPFFFFQDTGGIFNVALKQNPRVFKEGNSFSVIELLPVN